MLAVFLALRRCPDMPITRQQQRFLLDRLKEIQRDKPDAYAIFDRRPKPVKVRRAERQRKVADKIIGAYDDRRYAARDKYRAKLTAFSSEIRQIILFGDAPAAIRALDKFENTKF
jgi:hypothetical protein